MAKKTSKPTKPNTITIQMVHEEFCKHNKRKYVSKNIYKDLAWNCFAVATNLANLLKAQGIKARAVYGTWKGLSVEHKRNDFYRHGWVLINESEILDPTRWVFEGTKPYIFSGSEKNNSEYDEGMTQLRNLVARPFPSFNPQDKKVRIEWSPESKSLIDGITEYEDDVYSIQQVLWMANAPFKIWGDCIDEVYTKLEEQGFGALIPMDFKSKWKALKEMNHG